MPSWLHATATHWLHAGCASVIRWL